MKSLGTGNLGSEAWGLNPKSRTRFHRLNPDQGLRVWEFQPYIGFRV